MSTRLRLVVVALLALASTVYSNNTGKSYHLNIKVPFAVVTSAVEVSPSLLSFSLEADRWPEWIAVAPDYKARNQLTYNALNNLKTLTGTTPKVRIGGNTEDRAVMSGDVQVVSNTYPAPTTSMPYPEASNFTINHAYYQLARFAPSGTKMTFGLNFGWLNSTLAIEQAKSLLNAFKSNDVKRANVTLELIELGNEPNLYPNNGHRERSYNITTYVTEWSNFTSEVINATSLKKGTEPSIIALSLSGSDHGAGGFSPQKAFVDGLLSTPASEYISVISQHTYSGGCCSALISDLMSKSFIQRNLSAYAPDIKDVKSKGLDYVMGEVNSYYNHGVPNVSDSGGAAIWILDYTLYAATIGMSRLFFHQGIGFKYNLWQPISLDRSIQDGSPVDPSTPAHVQATYFGAIALAEFLGTEGPRLLLELDAPSPIISAYALYTHGTLSRVLLVNHEAYLSSTPPDVPRSNVTVFLQVNDDISDSVTLKRLSIPYADSKTGLKWAGRSFETSDVKPTGREETTKRDLEDGIPVFATEAVMVTFKKSVSQEG